MSSSASAKSPWNPEFRRQIWLEFSKFRLIGMPIFLGLVLYLASIGDTDDNVMQTAKFMFFVIIILWGNFRAVNAMADEIKENTWDFQKMSPQSPWSLVTGKLFGATSYTWYGGVICLAAIAYINAFGDLSLSNKMSTQELFHMFYIYIAAGIVGHAGGLLLCLNSISYNFGKGRIGMAGYTILAILLSSTLMSGEFLDNATSKADVNWYGNSIDFTTFYSLSLAYFLTCALISLYRSMRKELQFRDKPYAWLTFILSFIAYIGGFFDADIFGVDLNFKLGAWYSSAFAITLFFVYAWAYIEARNSVTYRRFFMAVEKRSWSEIFETTPLWMLTAIIMMISWIGLLSISPDNSNTMKYHTFLVALMLFICRDLGVLHLLFFGKNNRRAPLAFIIYLVVAYGLLAGIENGMAGFKKGYGVFAPIPGNNFIMAILPITVQLVLVGTLLKKMWLNKSEKTTEE